MGKKKEAAKLAAREAEIRAELERREAERKRAKKAKKKGKKRIEERKAEAVEPTGDMATAIAEAKAVRKALREAAKAGEIATAAIAGDPVATAEIAAQVIEGNSTPGAVASAEAALDRIESDDPVVAEIRARVAANRDRRLREMQAAGDEKAAKIRAAAKDLPPAEPDAHVIDTRKKKAPKPVPETIVNNPPTQVAEEVVTEEGREFAVGTSVAAPVDASPFGKPSEAPRTFEDNVNGLGQYKIFTPEGKERGYTRVTTYIDTLEDKRALERWKARIILEGVAAADDDPNATVVPRVHELVERRDGAIAKARRQDRKGKLVVGQLGTMIEGAWSEFKKGLNALADEIFELGGGREKAAKGTDIHELCAIAVKDGIDVVGEMLTGGLISPADLADVEAFLGVIEKMGAKVVEVERVMVDDDNRIAGRLDYVWMVKLPGMQRASRVVVDLKTGRVDYGAGKIAMQITKYSEMTGYDYDTHQREDLKLNRTKGLLVHLPAGSGKATVHVVDLGTGRLGLKLAGDVRQWRNTGKKAIDLASDALSEY